MTLEKMPPDKATPGPATHDGAPGSEPPASRRTALAVGVGALAAALGAGLAWQRFALDEPDPADFWQQSFATPEGGNIRAADLRGRPLLVNFWATWCPPCIEELPLLSRTYDKKKADGWQMIGLAIDQPDLVQRFLGRTPVSFPVALAGAGGVSLAKSLGNSAGGLPFTVIFDAQGKIRARKLGQVKPAELTAWLTGSIGPNGQD